MIAWLSPAGSPWDATPVSASAFTEVQTITALAVLPTITDAVTIDGYTQPGASENTLATGNDANLVVELNGNEVSSTGSWSLRAARRSRGS